MALTIMKNGRTRLAFRFGRISALRSTSDIVDQLQEQLVAERERHRFILAAKEKEIAVLIRDLVRLQYELAQRDVVDAFRDTPSPSAMMH